MIIYDNNAASPNKICEKNTHTNPYIWPLKNTICIISCKDGYVGTSENYHCSHQGEWDHQDQIDCKQSIIYNFENIGHQNIGWTKLIFIRIFMSILYIWVQCNESTANLDQNAKWKETCGTKSFNDTCVAECTVGYITEEETYTCQGTTESGQFIPNTKEIQCIKSNQFFQIIK